MGFDQESKKMVLRGFYPGITPQEVQDNTGFFIAMDQARPVDPPTRDELLVLRQQVDPQRLIL
jgi:glutaconate CoA-transferase subunit B